MAVKMIDRQWCACVGDYRYSFILDSADDKGSLPQCCTGSTALVAEKDGAVYLVNASGEWVEG
jgi:hypothetical protein